jgi:ribose-phosphate pyrophosphokinase
MPIQLFAKTLTGFTTPSKLETMVFPGGEPHVKDHYVQEENGLFEAQIAYVTQPTMEDLFTLALWADLVRSRKEKIWIGMPYLPFARADRDIPRGVDVFADFIATLGQIKLVALDPHSPVIINELVIKPVILDYAKLVKRAVGNNTYSGVIAPDKGAHDRASTIGKALGLPVCQAGKVRDADHRRRPLPSGRRHLRRRWNLHRSRRPSQGDAAHRDGPA